MDIIERIKYNFNQGSALTKLIYINVGVFVVIQTITVLFALFNFTTESYISYLAVPADLSLLLKHFWTLITYMFVHEKLFHILFNMLALFWFGKIYLMYFSEKQLVGLYVIGGLSGALLYIIAYNVFPFFAPLLSQSILLGASGSIMAIIVAAAVSAPNMELAMLFIGNIKLKYIAIISVLISFFGITSNNAGGEIAHLGGALCGYLFVVSLQQGKDLTAWVNKLFDAFSTILKPRKLKVKQNTAGTKPRMSDAEFNQNKARKMQQIDHILDKIKSSGYESLTSDEKKQLFEQGKK